MPADFDYPLSIFRTTTAHLAARTLLVCGTLALAVLLGAAIACQFGDQIGPVGALMLYPIMVFAGFYQLWGLLIYPPIVFIAAIYILREVRHWPLLLIFTLQTTEACRWCLSWTATK